MMNYKFGLNVYNYTPEHLLDYVIENNLNHIEINISKPHSSIDSFDQSRIENLKERISSHDIQLSIHLPNKINIADNIPTFRRKDVKYFKKVIQLSEQLEVKYINFHMGFFFWFPIEKWKRENALKRFVKNLKPLLEICEDKNIILAMENVVPLPHGFEHNFLGDSLDDFSFVFDQINSSLLKFCLDTGHANIAEGVRTYLNHYSDKLIAIHYHDNFGNDDSHFEIGKGNIDWDCISSYLNKMEFTGPYISECRNSKPHVSALKFKEYLRKN